MCMPVRNCAIGIEGRRSMCSYIEIVEAVGLHEAWKEQRRDNVIFSQFYQDIIDILHSISLRCTTE